LALLLVIVAVAIQQHLREQWKLRLQEIPEWELLLPVEIQACLRHQAVVVLLPMQALLLMQVALAAPGAI
jgi:hypothetical protein